MDHADTDSAPLLEVRGLGKRFGRVRALEDVSFTVERGECFFVLGPSGCGKSTLLRVLAGLESPDSGTVLLAGRDLARLGSHERGMPMVFQNYALWPHLSVYGNVAFGLVERGVSRAEIRRRVAAALEQVGLGGLEDRMPAQLSGGQQQRVALARVLVVEPRIVLLDEPLSNLDAGLRQEMRRELKRIHAQAGLTLVYVTHDQAEALSLADRMALLEAGRVRGLGTPRELYHRPPNTFCAAFLGEANFFPATLRSFADGYARLTTPWGEWRGVTAGETRPAPGASVTCMVRPEHLRPVRPSAAGAGEGNRLRARVRSVQMLGSTVALLLQAGDRELRALALNTPADACTAGTAGEWEVAPAETVVVPETPAAASAAAGGRGEGEAGA